MLYIFKKEDCDCRFCLYYERGKCTLETCCCLEDKLRTGSPFVKPHDNGYWIFYPIFSSETG